MASSTGRPCWAGICYKLSREMTIVLNWNHLAAVERAESFQGSWDSTIWFEEDYCEGPGRISLSRHPAPVK